jgi:hypothetical protein
MNTLTSMLVVVTGIALRLIVPIALTALVVYFLRKLDARWQAEAEFEKKMLIKDEAPCWKEQGLSTDEIKLKAVASGQPCWQIHRLSNGYLREECLDCEVFLSAPIPNPKHTEAHA